MKVTALFAILFAFVSTATAATRIWEGDVNGRWSQGFNWSPIGEPQPGDDLVFPSGSGQSTLSNDITGLRIRSLAFDKAFYVRGNPFTISNGITCSQQGGDVIIEAPITLGGNQRFYTEDDDFMVTSNLNLGGFDLTLESVNDKLVSLLGAVTGTGNISVQVPGTRAEMGGFGDNSFVGTVAVDGGAVLTLSKQTGEAVRSRLEIYGSVHLAGHNQIRDSAEVYINGGALLLDGHIEFLGNLELLDFALIDSGASTGILNLSSAQVTVRGTTSVRINGRLGLTTTTSGEPTEFFFPTISSVLEVNANVSGGGFGKSGPGTMRLRGTNSYSGSVMVTGGNLEAYHPTAFGAAGSAFPVTLDGAAITLQGVTVANETLVVGPGGGTLGGINNCGWAGPVTLTFSQDLIVVAADASFSGTIMNLSGPITGFGGGGLDIAAPIFGTGTLRLSGSAANTFTGVTRLNNARLELAKSSNVRAFSGPLIVGGIPGAAAREVRWLNNFQLPPNATITVNSNGLLSLNDFTDSMGPLTFSGGRINLAADSALTLTANVTANPTNLTALIDGATGLGGLFLSGQRTFNVGDGSVVGPDLRIDARIASGGITKIGAGTLALGGNNSFGGAVNIGNGVVRVDHDNGLGSPNAGTVVSNGATLFLASAADLVREPVTLNGTGFGGTNGALMASGAVVLSNNVVLASPSTIRVDSAWQLKIDGVISGTGPLTKIGAGTLTFAGTANNTFTGDTLVNAGTLQLDKSDFLQSVPGNLIIGTGGFFPTPATVRHFSQDQIWANVTVNFGSLLDLNGHEEYLVALTLNGGGDVQTGAGLLTVDAGNSITVNPGIGLATSSISGRLGLRTGNHNINVSPFAFPPAGGPELDIPAQVILYNGLANVHKRGSGQMRLGGSNTFTGVLYVDDGSVVAANNAALGTTQGSTVVQTNGVLAFDGGITTGDFIILDSAAFPSLVSMNGTNVATNGVNLIRPNNGLEVQSAAGALQLRGRVGSVGGLTKLGPGVLQFFGPIANDYTGLTILSNGVIEASRGNLLTGQGLVAIPGDFIVGDDTTVATTAILRLLQSGQVRPATDGAVRRSGLLDLVPRIPLPNTSARLRTVTGMGRVNLGSGTSLTISNDVSFDFDGSISGAGALNKYGAGATMHLTRDSTFSGPTTVWEGFYRMDGSASSSPVTVKLEASLRGDGRVGDLTVESGGFVAPNSEAPGHHGADLQMSSANFLPGGILNLGLYGPHQTGGNDSLLVNGPVTLGGTRLSSGFQYAPREGDILTLIRKTTAGAITGTFNGYPEGAQRLYGEIPVVMSYVGGDGNDVTLTVTNLAAGAGGWQITSGNGNGLVEPDECDLLFLGVQNRRNTTITLSNVVLRSITPSALVTIATAAYPTIPAASIRSNVTPFQIRTLPTHPCGAPVAVELQVTIVNEGTFAIPFTLPGGTSCTNGGGACESCTIVSGTFSTNTPLLFRRLLATGAPSICFPEKPCPGADDGTNLPPARYLEHTFTNTTGADACLTAQLHFDCPIAPVGALHVAAYLGDLDPTAACANYLGDTGAAVPDDYPPFSFHVPAGSNFTLVVSTRTENIGCDSYWLELFGLPCPSPKLYLTKDSAPEKVLLQWSTAYPGWRLQSTNSLRSPGANSFSNVPGTPVIAGGQYTVTNAVTPAKQFFRLTR